MMLKKKNELMNLKRNHPDQSGPSISFNKLQYAKNVKFCKSAKH